MSFYKDNGLPVDAAFVTLVFPKGWKTPPGFPRRQLACENPQGTRTYHVNAQRLLAWVKSVPTGVSK